MPLYVYRCRECGESFEKIVSLSASAEKPNCPKCASRRTEKQIAAPNAFAAKGTSGSGCGSSKSKFT